METEASNIALIDNCLMCTVYFVCFVTPSTIFCYIILILLTLRLRCFISAPVHYVQPEPCLCVPCDRCLAAPHTCRGHRLRPAARRRCVVTIS